MKIIKIEVGFNEDGTPEEIRYNDFAPIECVIMYYDPARSRIGANIEKNKNTYFKLSDISGAVKYLQRRVRITPNSIELI
jgi:hypothetical protein